MFRVLVLASLVLVSAPTVPGQVLSVLQIKVVVGDAEHATPVARHLLLVSDNPASAPPRRIFTKADGSASVSLTPGNYTVESDRPIAFGGKAYQWTQMIDIVAGRDAVLELTAGNADVEPVTSATTDAAAPLAADPSFLLPQWQDGVVAIWTPHTRASGFVFGAKGLLVTNQRSIGTATAVEVQLTRDIKVAARVLAADAGRDVAVLWVDPTLVAALRPMPLQCTDTTPTSFVAGDELFTIGAPLREPKGMTSGTASRVRSQMVVTDLRLASGSTGGPVFAAGGSLVGITSVVDDQDDHARGAARIVGIDAVCQVVASADAKLTGAARPDPTRLPVEPVRPFPIGALTDAASQRAGGLGPHKMSSSDFEIAFITPVLTYAAEHQGSSAMDRARGQGPGKPDAAPTDVRRLLDFGHWSEYMSDSPPVLAIRVTPKLVEGFWTTVARGAARTQGVSLPPIKHVKAGFARMQAFCGDAAVTPIHPFTLEQRISETDAVDEGLYVFDPGALGPHCGTVKLVLYSEKEPEKGDARVVDPQVIQQIWQLFAPYRALDSAAAVVPVPGPR